MSNKRLIFVIALLCATTVVAQEDSFFTDPSLLRPMEHGIWDLAHKPKDGLTKLQRYSAIMVDQPEILIRKNSKYKGGKGDDLKQLADVGRLAMMERLEAGGWPVVHEPGPNVILMRWAIDVRLNKKKRNLLSYTPAGFVVHTTAQAVVRDLWKKVDIVDFGLQTEWLDSKTGEILAAGVINQGIAEGRKVISWEELDATFKTVGEQMRCALDNNKLPAGSKKTDCDRIVIKPVKSSGPG